MLAGATVDSDTAFITDKVNKAALKKLIKLVLTETVQYKSLVSSVLDNILRSRILL